MQTPFEQRQKQFRPLAQRISFNKLKLSLVLKVTIRSNMNGQCSMFRDLSYTTNSTIWRQLVFQTSLQRAENLYICFIS